MPPPNNYDGLAQKITELATNFNNLFQSLRDHKDSIESLVETNSKNEINIAILDTQIQALKKIEEALPELIEFARDINQIADDNHKILNEIKNSIERKVQCLSAGFN